MSDARFGEEPEHLIIPVNEHGDGPVSEDEFHHYACWCGEEHEPYTTPADGQAKNPFNSEHPLRWAEDYLGYVTDHFYNKKGWYTGQRRATYDEYVAFTYDTE